MKTKFTRTEIKELLAYLELVNLGATEREDLILDNPEVDFESITDFMDTALNPILHSSIVEQYIGVKNSFLSQRLALHIGTEVPVEGPIESLFPCPCCYFKSLPDRGEYSVCKVCAWEDDGQVLPDQYSPANRITLAEARLNFLKFGANKEEALAWLRPDRLEMYEVGGIWGNK